MSASLRSPRWRECRWDRWSWHAELTSLSWSAFALLPATATIHSCLHTASFVRITDVSPLWCFAPSLDVSPSVRFVLKTFRTQDVSPPGHFAPSTFSLWTFRPLPRRFAPSLDVSPPTKRNVLSTKRPEGETSRLGAKRPGGETS